MKGFAASLGSILNKRRQISILPFSGFFHNIRRTFAFAMISKKFIFNFILFTYASSC